jgi:nucleotide-binding universal stress UspA family protein
MFSHILIPLAPPLVPKTALMTAAALSVEQSAHVTLLCVIEKQYRFPSPLAIWTDRKRIAGFLGNASAIVSEFGMQPSTRIARGIPGCKVIKNVAAAIGADAIVVGTQRRAGEDTLDYGLAIQALLGEISVPVIVIHESPLWQQHTVASELAS